MHAAEKVILTNMCMVYNKDKVLVQDRRKKSYKGIIFPGGHIEKGESFVDSVIREVKEETGLTIKNPKLCGIKQWTNVEDESRYIVLLYKTDEFFGNLQSSDEGEVFWTSLSKLKEMDCVSDIENMLNVFLNDEISEFCYFFKDEEWIELLK